MATQQQTQEESRTQQSDARNEQGNQNRDRGRSRTRNQSIQTGRENREQQGGRALQQQSGLLLPSFMTGPFSLIRMLQDDIDRAFGLAARNQMSRANEGTPGTQQNDWSPAIETFQRGNEFVVRVALPGLSADDVTVEIGEDALTIRGELRDEHQEEREGMYVSELSYGAFIREIPLPPGAIPEDAKAQLRNGVLEIVVPAPSQEVRRGRRLQIQGGENERSDQRSQQQNR